MRGLYIHIPFCKEKCKYCDFCSVKSNYDNRAEYCDYIIKEIELYKEEIKFVDTIFIGGGTPSILEAQLFRFLLESLGKYIDIDNIKEFSVECNPGTVSQELIDVFKEYNVNRVSLGLQTTNDELLKLLGRIHNYDEFKESYYLLRKNGFDNINVDFIYSLPNQTIRDIKRDLLEITRLNPEHISYYSLKIEDGTPLFQMLENGVIKEIDEEIDREMYHIIIETLNENGYNHYEISNFAKEGFECKHNLKYWKNQEYIGIGISAHGYINNKRYSNYSNFKSYYGEIECGNKAIKEIQTIDEDESFIEEVMLGLRLKDGIELEKLKEKYGKDFYMENKDEIDKNIESGYMKMNQGRLYLSSEGFDISNYIISRLI